MTNEEAIRFGNCILMVAGKETDSTAIEFTRMAIKALETIPKYKDAYNKGYEAGVKATNVDCGVVWEERIDAIKDDIQSIFYPFKDGTGIVQEVLSIIDKHCGGENE